MSFGKMNTRIQIGIFRQVKDADGFAASVYESIVSVRAYREGRHGSEKWANRATFSDATDLFRFRVTPNTEITTDMVILTGGHTFQITSVEDVKGKGMYIEVLAKEVKPSGKSNG